MIGRLTSTAEVVGENGKGVCDLIAPEPSLCLKLRNDRYTCSHVFGKRPLGYDASERPLVINPAEAETVRRICRKTNLPEVIRHQPGRQGTGRHTLGGIQPRECWPG